MSKKTGKLKRFLMAVGLSVLSICTLNQIADAAIDDSVVKYRKTGLKNSMVRYQLEFEKSDIGEGIDGLYLGTSSSNDVSGLRELTSQPEEDTGNKIYLQGEVDNKVVYVIEVKSTEKELTIAYMDDNEDKKAKSISIGAGKGTLENSGPVVNWICCGRSVGEEEDTSKNRVEISVADSSTYIDKIVALNAVEEGGAIIPEENDPDIINLVKVESSKWKKEDVLQYNTSEIPEKPGTSTKAGFIRIYDILGNYTDVKAPTDAAENMTGPVISWAYKSEDKIWKSNVNKNENKVEYIPEEVNYIQFEANDPNCIIMKLVDEDGKDRVLIDEMLQQKVVTAKYRFNPEERYFFVENYFGYKTLVSLDGTHPEQLPGIEGYTPSDNDCIVDVSYVIAAKNADGTNVAISMVIPKSKELISINTEEDVDISFEKAQAEDVKESPAVWTAKHEGEVRRGNDKLVATYVGVPEGTTHVDVRYGERTLINLGNEENFSRTIAITPEKFKEIHASKENEAAKEAGLILIKGNFDMNELEYDEKVVVDLETVTNPKTPTTVEELDATPEYKVKVPILETPLEKGNEESDAAYAKRYNSACTSAFEELVEPDEEHTGATDGRYVPHDKDNPRVIVPLGKDETFAGLEPYEKVIIVDESVTSATINNLSDQEKVKVEKTLSADVPSGYKKINRDKSHMYKLGCKYDITHKYDIEWKYDLEKKYDPGHKWDINNKYDTTKKYGVGEEGGAKEIPVELDLDLVAPKVVLRNTGVGQDGEISDEQPEGENSTIKARVYKNRASAPDQAIIEVTDVVSGIAKIVAVVNDPETDLKNAREEYREAQKKINAITVAQGKVEALETAQSTLIGAEAALVGAQSALTTAVCAVDGHEENDYEDADDALVTAIHLVESAVCGVDGHEGDEYNDEEPQQAIDRSAAVLAEINDDTNEDYIAINTAQDKLIAIVDAQVNLAIAERNKNEAQSALTTAVRAVAGHEGNDYEDADNALNTAKGQAMVAAELGEEYDSSAIAAAKDEAVTAKNEAVTAKETAEAAYKNTLPAVEKRLAEAKAAKLEAQEALTDAVQALGGDYTESDYTAAEAALVGAQEALTDAVQALGGNYTELDYTAAYDSNLEDEIDDSALAAAEEVAVTAAKEVVPDCEDYSNVSNALNTARGILTDKVRDIGGEYVTANYTKAAAAQIAARTAIKNALAIAYETYNSLIDEILGEYECENLQDVNTKIDEEEIIGEDAYAVATAAAEALDGNSQAAGCKAAIELAVVHAQALDVAKKNVEDMEKAIEVVENIVEAKEKVDNITSAQGAITEAESNIQTEENARDSLLEAEKTSAKRHELIDVRGLPKSVVQLMNLPAGAKYIKVYDGIGNCNTIEIANVTKINGNNTETNDENSTGLTLDLVLDDDDGETHEHIVEVDYRSSTVGMRSFVRAVDEETAVTQHVTPARETMYGEKEFMKNEAYDYDDEDKFEYMFETLQTSKDIAMYYPVAPQVSDIRGAQLQGEPYCWAVDAFGNVAKYDLNKVLFKGDDDDHYVMMDKNGDITTAISVKVEDLRRVKKIAAIIDEEEITLETFETGDTPSASGTGPEDVDRVYEIGEGIVGDVIIYHTNDKTVLTSHQNVVDPMAVSSNAEDRAQYVQLIENENHSYKAIVKYGIKRIDYSDDTVIEFYDEIPKDVDVYLRGTGNGRWVEITDALGYTYKINEGDTAETEYADLNVYAPDTDTNTNTDPDPEP